MPHRVLNPISHISDRISRGIANRTDGCRRKKRIGPIHFPGRRANLPTNGCRIEDVIWNTSVIMPICPNVKPYLSFITGYIDGMIDCTISLSKCIPFGQPSIAWFSIVALIAGISLIPVGKWYKKQIDIVEQVGNTDYKKNRQYGFLPGGGFGCARNCAPAAYH